MTLEMNEHPAGPLRSALKDEGIQRALAGVVVAFVVAGARKLIFRS